MATPNILQQMFQYNDWANAKIVEMSSLLAQDQIDTTRPMGFGSLRNTVFHILEAESLWLERWQAKPWRAFVADAKGTPLTEISAGLLRVSNERKQLLEFEAPTNYTRAIRFRNSEQNEFSHSLGDLMLHVANHGIYHRAQALSFLKDFGQTVPGGLDFLFWKVAYPSCQQPEESLQPLRDYGLSVAVEPGMAPTWDNGCISKYFAFGDWANQRVFDSLSELTDENLDRSFLMGMGSIRKTIQHIIDAERWWFANWFQNRAPFPRGESPRSLGAMGEMYAEVSAGRNDFISTLDKDTCQRVVEVSAGGPFLCFRVIESFLQLCGHGTHHRAQINNMLRQLGATPPSLDYSFWLNTA